MNPHGRPWASDEARAAAQRRWSTFRERPQDIHRLTKAEARRNGHKGGLRSGQVRQAKARQAAVAAALAILHERRPHAIVEALHRLYAKAYSTGRDVAVAKYRQRRSGAHEHSRVGHDA